MRTPAAVPLFVSATMAVCALPAVPTVRAPPFTFALHPSLARAQLWRRILTHARRAAAALIMAHLLPYPLYRRVLTVASGAMTARMTAAAAAAAAAAGRDDVLVGAPARALESPLRGRS
ncbi:MAG: hypothetical protein EOO77_27290, partial [Oxalobacteraceae bacterium]